LILQGGSRESGTDFSHRQVHIPRDTDVDQAFSERTSLTLFPGERIPERVRKGQKQLDLR
jgi:hypothetical protein